MLALALSQLHDNNDQDREITWKHRLMTEFPVVYARATKNPDLNEHFSDDAAITLLMAGYTFSNTLVLGEDAFRMYLTLSNVNPQTYFDTYLLTLLNEKKCGHLTVLIQGGARPTYMQLYEMCSRMCCSQDLLTELSTHEYKADVEQLNYNPPGYALFNHYHSTFYTLVKRAPLLALRYIHTPNLNLFGLGKSSLLHYCIWGVDTDTEYGEASKEAWVTLFGLLIEYEPRVVSIPNGVNDTPRDTLATERGLDPANIYFQRMETLLPHQE